MRDEVLQDPMVPMLELEAEAARRGAAQADARAERAGRALRDTEAAVRS